MGLWGDWWSVVNGGTVEQCPRFCFLATRTCRRRRLEGWRSQRSRVFLQTTASWTTSHRCVCCRICRGEAKAHPRELTLGPDLIEWGTLAGALVHYSRCSQWNVDITYLTSIQSCIVCNMSCMSMENSFRSILPLSVKGLVRLSFKLNLSILTDVVKALV